MKVVGIVAEYNPFHNGHLYHLNESVRQTGADYVVSVMSGNFIQRGQPAIMDKWNRTKMALNMGVDLVIEIPVIYAMSTAEFFARSAVGILDATHIVDYISFGCETADIQGLNSIADILCQEESHAGFSRFLKEQLSKGVSYPAARQTAICQYVPDTFKEQAAKIISTPNNILAIEYLKALKRLNSIIIPVAISRKESGYNSETMTPTLSSATAIRKRISLNLDEHTGLLSDVQLIQNLPEKSLMIMDQAFNNQLGPVYQSPFDDLILYKLRTMQIEEIAKLPYIVEGLENRIRQAARSCASLGELIDTVKTKRYPQTTIQRILYTALLNMTKDELLCFNHYGFSQYIRVLGFSSKGRALLPRIKEKASLPLITSPSQLTNSCNPLVKRMFEIEQLSTDIYMLAYKNKEHRHAGQEFTQKMLVGT